MCSFSALEQMYGVGNWRDFTFAKEGRVVAKNEGGREGGSVADAGGLSRLFCSVYFCIAELVCLSWHVGFCMQCKQSDQKVQLQAGDSIHTQQSHCE